MNNKEKIYEEAKKMLPKLKKGDEFDMFRICVLALQLQQDEIIKKIDKLPVQNGNLINKDKLKVLIDKDTYKILECKKCKKEMLHLKCGFGESGSLCGNGRWRCLKKGCKQERI